MIPTVIRSEKDFNAELEKGGRRLALFYSAWCPFCASFLPVFEKQAGASTAAFLKVCTDDLPGLEEKFSIEVVPSVLCFEEGKLSARLDGALGRGLTSEGLRAFLETPPGSGGR